MHPDFNKFKDAIIEAAAAARAVDNPKDDGGTCNMDTCLITLKGWKEPEVQELAAATGIQIGEKITSGYFKGDRFLWLPHNGQAMNRTRMMEAGKKVLDKHLVPATMWYQMD